MHCTITIDLRNRLGFSYNTYWRPLERWLDRADHPSEKVAEIDFQYTASGQPYSFAHQVVGYIFQSDQKPRLRAELEKMTKVQRHAHDAWKAAQWHKVDSSESESEDDE